MHKKYIVQNICIVFTIFALIFSMYTINKLSNRIDEHKEFVAKVKENNKDIQEGINKLKAGISQNDIRRWNIVGIKKWILQTNKKLDNITAINYATAIVDEAERQKVDIALIAAVIHQESNYRYDAISDSSAIGLMGIMEETGRWICKEIGTTCDKKSIMEPEVNIRLGTWFLRYLMNKYDKNEKLVLAHYNGGNKQRNKYILREKYKKTKEYKLSIEEIKDRLFTIEVELIAAGKTQNEFHEDVNYKYLKDIYKGKTLSPETEKYIPQVLVRRTKIKKFLTNSESLNS